MRGSSLLLLGIAFDSSALHSSRPHLLAPAHDSSSHTGRRWLLEHVVSTGLEICGLRRGQEDSRSAVNADDRSLRHPGSRKSSPAHQQQEESQEGSHEDGCNKSKQLIAIRTMRGGGEGDLRTPTSATTTYRSTSAQHDCRTCSVDLGRLIGCLCLDGRHHTGCLDVSTAPSKISRGCGELAELTIY